MTSFLRATTAPPTLTKAEQKILLVKTGQRRGAEREHMLYSLTLGTALRQHELVALNVGDVFRNGKPVTRIYLSVFKGSRRRAKVPVKADGPPPPKSPKYQIVSVPRGARRKIAYFVAWKKKHGESVAPDAPLFCAAQAGFGAEAGDRLSTRSIRHHIRVWQKRCGFERLQGFHSLRHTALTNLYEATRDLRAVQAQARHADVNTTEIYTHLSLEQISRAVEDLPC